ncbi:CPBP family intramembrane metalloprotease domain-containing protein, partial [Aeromonas australiensis]|nr:CPBP family intramembrane metalloprotease domain-containing protein [Aeromonas australiensis]
MLPLPDSLIWGVLALAVLFALFRLRPPAFALLGLSLLLAIWLDRMTLPALLVLVAGLLLAWRTPTLPARWAMAARVVLILWAIALTLHLIPGFNNLKVLDQVLAGPASVPFNMYLNLDKPLLFFGLLLAWPTLLGGSGAIRWRPLGLLLLPLGALLVLAWQLGALKPEVGLPHWW